MFVNQVFLLRYTDLRYRDTVGKFTVLLECVEGLVSWNGVCRLGTCKPPEEGRHARAGDDRFVVLPTAVQVVKRGTLGLTSEYLEDVHRVYVVLYHETV